MVSKIIVVKVSVLTFTWGVDPDITCLGELALTLRQCINVCKYFNTKLFSTLILSN